MAVAPHCPLGSIALGGCIKPDACTPNVFIQEQSLGIHYNKGGDLLDYRKDPTIYHYRDGFLDISDAVGLGVEINEDFVKEASKRDINWKNPIWRNFDRTVAEW